MSHYDVLTPAGVFTYTGENLERGDVVIVPLRGSKVTGIVLGRTEWEGKAEEVMGSLDIKIPGDVLDLSSLLSLYYLTPLERFLSLILPPSLHRRAEKCYIRVSSNPPTFKRMEHIDLWEYLTSCRTLNSIKRKFKKDYRDLLNRWVNEGHVEIRERYRVPRQGKIKALEYAQEYALPSKPTPEQERSIYRLKEAIRAGRYRSFLLWGETGSGKTFVYLKAAEEAVRLGKSVLVLVPELLLSYHIARAFYEAFGESFALYHSGITAKQRANVWFASLKGDLKVVMAVKSGVFIPMKNLGLVVVDEEHEGSYKESDRPPKFNARDVAVFRAYLNGAVALLGSATPSLESYHNAKRRKYILLRLKRTPSRKVDVRIVDMRKRKEVLSSEFRENFERALKEGKGAIIFLNRRGFLPYYYCEECGNPLKCPNCDTVLALHKGDILRCHICGYTTYPPATCPVCDGPNLRGSGTGTQKIEDMIREEYNVPVARLDTDSVRRRKEIIDVLERFGEGKVRVLVGTKMVIKGLDFKNVGFVGVVNADSFLSRPADFRAEEKTYQALVQVIGRIRAGGTAVIQTRMPKHRVIESIVHGDTQRFYRELYEARRELLLPPFRRMAIFEVRSKSERVWKENEKILTDFALNYTGKATLWGPYLPSVAKVKNWYRLRLTVLFNRHSEVEDVARAIGKLPLRGKVSWDVGPYDVD